MEETKEIKKNWMTIKLEARVKRDEEKKFLDEAMELGRKANWKGLLKAGLNCPPIMERLCSSYYRQMPDEYKYFIPVYWYMHGGKCAKSVLQAFKRAKKYKPENWIGLNSLPSTDGFDVYIGTRCPYEQVADEIAWTKDYYSAYVQASAISGKVYRAYIKPEGIIAIDSSQVNSILQYRSVMGIEQLFPKLPM